MLDCAVGVCACGIFLKNTLAAKATDHHKVKDLCKQLFDKKLQYKVCFVCVCVRACVRACVCTRMHMFMCVHVCVSMLGISCKLRNSTEAY